MSRNTAEIAAEWDRQGHTTTDGGTFNDLHKRLIYLERTHFSQYVPTFGVDHPDFELRLFNWLENVSDDDDKRLLFEFAAEITFFTREDFAKLYQSAVSGPISRWLIDLSGFALDDMTLSESIKDMIHRGTWYCPMSDSMPISDFHHANGIGGIQFRPDWRSLVTFCELQRLSDFFSNQNPPIERVVILEDFVGAGWQASENLRLQPTPSGNILLNAFSFASIMPHIEFLFVPLIICPEGANVVRQLVAPFQNIEVAPVLELSDSELANPNVSLDPDRVRAKIRDFCIRVYANVKGRSSDPRPYGPFGNGDIGSRIVTYSNTPAGTLPIVHHRSETWQPVFPRSARVK